MKWNLKHSYILITESDCQIKIIYFGLALKLELGENEKKTLSWMQNYIYPEVLNC